MRQHYFDVPFAFAGDVAAIPDPLQVGGTVSMTEGWNFNYQRNLSTDPAALPIDRSTMNWLLLQISTAIQALQQQGVPEFINSAQNGGVAFSYGKGSVVLWSASGNPPFSKYVSLTAGNTNTPSAGDPQGLTTGWQIVVDPIATAAQATAGTDDASIMTPLKVAQQTALRALLAGNASQVFNVGPATSTTHAVEFGQLTGIVGEARGLSGYNASAAATLTLSADETIVETALGGLQYKNSSWSQLFTGTNVGANGMDTGSMPVNGFVAIYRIYNPTSNTWALLGTNVTSTLAPNIYGGGNMPSGYTASALLTVLPTNGSSQFPAGILVHGRRVTRPPISVLAATANQGTYTSFSLTTNNGAPKNAIRVGGGLGAGGNATTGGDANMFIAADANGTGEQGVNGYEFSGVASGGSYQCDIATAQTLYWKGNVSAGTVFNFSVTVVWYDI